jgi:hypothetical protein
VPEVTRMRNEMDAEETTVVIRGCPSQCDLGVGYNPALGAGHKFHEFLNVVDCCCGPDTRFRTADFGNFSSAQPSWRFRCDG